jgi:hypothetical protein
MERGIDVAGMLTALLVTVLFAVSMMEMVQELTGPGAQFDT